MLTDFTLESTSEMASNYMAPVNVDRMPEVLNQGEIIVRFSFLSIMTVGSDTNLIRSHLQN